MSYVQHYFSKDEISIKTKKINYYLSPKLSKNNFKHGFFTKKSSEINLTQISTYFDINNNNCVLNQIHSNRIIFGSQIMLDKEIEADGLICDNKDQNLWIYTADCMPILFADKVKRRVAAIHCGRKGLENKIIKNLIIKFDNLGSRRGDLIVAIGPSISKKNYLVDRKILKDFYKNINSNKEKNSEIGETNEYIYENYTQSDDKFSNPLDLRKYAYNQLLEANIPNINIDISNLCTYDSNHDFYSWRRSKTSSRQWNFICS